MDLCSRNRARTKVASLEGISEEVAAKIGAIIRMRLQMPSSTISRMRRLSLMRLMTRMRTPSGTISTPRRKLGISLGERSLRK